MPKRGISHDSYEPLPTNHSQGTNPHAAQRTSLVALGKSLWRIRQLIVQMTRREVMGPYKGSVMGLAWSFFNPVFMLVVYTFVFSMIFRSRWGVGGEESKTQFAVVLFVGMIVHGLFAEVLNRAPGLIISNITKQSKMRVYFAYPHCPWEWGTNENTNGLLRQFFSKGTRFTRLSRTEIKQVQVMFNDRTRNVLNWHSPAHAFYQLLR